MDRRLGLLTMVSGRLGGEVSLQGMKAVDDPREAIGQHAKQCTDAGEQEYRGDRQLNDVGDG